MAHFRHNRSRKTEPAEVTEIIHSKPIAPDSIAAPTGDQQGTVQSFTTPTPAQEREPSKDAPLSYSSELQSFPSAVDRLSATASSNGLFATAAVLQRDEPAPIPLIVTTEQSPALAQDREPSKDAPLSSTAEQQAPTERAPLNTAASDSELYARQRRTPSPSATSITDGDAKTHIRNWSEIDGKASRYYEEIVALCKKNRDLSNVTFIVVDHCLQTFESHVDSLSKLGRVAGVILKSSTRVKEAEEFANKYCKVLDVSKEALKDPQVAIDLVLENTEANEKLVIMDHGGYFSCALKGMMANEEVRKRLIGVAEVTENGHYKLNRALKETPIPNLSVARSELKELEDAQTGVAICDATNTILYSVHSALNSLQNVCVIGYGKIGRSIANSCKKRGIPEVTVIEVDPLRAQSAMIDGNRVVMGTDTEAKARAFQKAQVLFSATGSRVLSSEDIPNLRKIDRSSEGTSNPVLFIASCTSPDDEFDESFFEELKNISRNSVADRKACEEQLHLSPYELFDGRKIYILNEGKAVNFAIGGTPGFEICQVWASVLYTAAKLAAQEVPSSCEVQGLTRDEQLQIGRITHEVYFSNSFSDTKPKANMVPKKPGLQRSRSASSLSSSDMWSSASTPSQASTFSSTGDIPSIDSSSGSKRY